MRLTSRNIQIEIYKRITALSFGTFRGKHMMRLQLRQSHFAGTCPIRKKQEPSYSGRYKFWHTRLCRIVCLGGHHRQASNG